MLEMVITLQAMKTVKLTRMMDAKTNAESATLREFCH